MGLFSGIKKGIKNIFKGIGKVAKKVFKAVGKFASSKFGQLVIASAAIYFTGGAAGLWSTPLNPAVATTTLGAATTGAGGVALTSGTGLAVTAPVAASANAAGGALVAAETAGGAFTASQAVNAGLSASETAGIGAAQQGATGGFLSTAAKYAADNPALVLAAGKGISAAVSDSPYDTWRKQQEWTRKNSNVAGVNGDGSGSPIGLGLIQQGQQSDLYTPTYNQSAPQQGGGA